MALGNPSKRNKGEIVANFKRGRGDNMGTAGRLNDNADKTAPVISYWPNEYGLYNMARQCVRMGYGCLPTSCD